MVSFEASTPSSKLARLQTAQQDLAFQFVSYCQDRGLQPFLAAGSALGAWRDQAMIAWDDDIDFGMLREDYDRFVAAFMADPIPGVSIQNCETVARYPFAFSKLRIDGTSVDESPTLGKEHHAGIFIDVFPYDRLPANPIVRRIQYGVLLTINLFVLSYSRQFAMGATNPIFRGARLIAVMLRPIMPISAMIALREWLYRTPRITFSDEMICFQMYGMRRSGKTRMPRSGLVPPQQAPFGTRQMPVPADCESYLTRIFGDYRRLPPEDQRQPSHISDVDFGPLG